jgi:uncharacterized protein with HEPN domain
MTKPPEVFLKHMLLAIQDIKNFTKGYTYNKFQKDKKTNSAVVRQLEILGEAAGRIPKNLVKDSPIEWNKITRMRHKLIHNYFGVDMETVWETSQKGLISLKTYLENKLD